MTDAGFFFLLLFFFGLGWWLRGRWEKRHDRPGKWTKKKQDEPRAMAVEPNHSYSVKGMTDLKWYWAVTLILDNNFTMEAAATHGLDRKVWQRVKTVWLKNELIYKKTDRTVAPLPEKIDQLKRVREQSIKKMARANNRRTIEQTIGQGFELLDPKEGWKEIRR